MEPKIKKQNIVDKLAVKYIHDTAKLNINESDEPHIINAKEKLELKKIKYRTLAAAAIIGAVAVLLLYLPQYYFPKLFLIAKIKFWGIEFDFEWVSTIYGILLIWPELWALNAINLKAVRDMSKAFVYPRPNLPDFELHVESLKDAGLENQQKGIEKFGIDPYLHMPKTLFWMVLIFTRLKATLSNIVFKIIIKRILGRFAVRQVTDLSGIPIFSFWNAWASAQVIAEAKIRIMAPMALNHEILYLKKLNPDFIKHIFPALQFAIAQKRKYNYAQYYWTNLLFQKFHFETHDTYNYQNFIETMEQEHPEVKEAISRIIACALIIDGKISLREQNAVEKLQTYSWFAYTPKALSEMGKAFNLGNGLNL